MIDELTPVFQEGAALAIDLNSQLFGLPAKIYYPKMIGSYSGRFDDLSFSDTPDDEQKLLIPDLYNVRRTPMGGINDVLGADTYTLYLNHSQNIPTYSKIVVDSDTLGLMQFIVGDNNAVSTIKGTIYKEVTITPYVSFRANEITESSTPDLVQDYIDGVKDFNFDDDNSTVSSTISNNKMLYKFSPLK